MIYSLKAGNTGSRLIITCVPLVPRRLKNQRLMRKNIGSRKNVNTVQREAAPAQDMNISQEAEMQVVEAEQAMMSSCSISSDPECDVCQ